MTAAATIFIMTAATLFIMTAATIFIMTAAATIFIQSLRKFDSSDTISDFY